MAYQLINNLRFGQVSERMAGRFDMDVYRQGAQRLENFVCMRQGGVTRRPPVRLLADARSDTERIVSLTLDSHDSVCILLSPSGFSSYGYTLASDGSFEFTEFTDHTAWPKGWTPTASEIRSMVFAQHYSYMYVACRTLPLGRFLHTASSLSFEVCRVLTNGTDDEIAAQGFRKDDLMKTSNDYPGGVAVSYDRLILFGTKAEKDTIWFSRSIGSSQTIEDAEDSLLDFVQYDVVDSNVQTIRDASEWPLARKTDSTGKGLYHTGKIGGGEIRDLVFSTKDAYEDSSFQGDRGVLYQTVKTSSSTFEGDVGSIYVFQDAAYTIQYKPNGRASNALSSLVEGVDYWRWPIWEYDLSDASKLVSDSTEKDYVETATTAMKNQLATGRTDRVLWACMMDNMYVGTESSIWVVPAGANALSISASRLAVHPLSETQPVSLGGMLVYATKGGRVRGLSASDGAVSDSELTLTADGIIDSPIMCMESMDIPEPTLYMVLEDGTMRTLTMDSDYGLQGWTKWSFGFEVKSLAKIEDGLGTKLLCLVDEGGSKWIGRFDYDAVEGFEDDSKVDGGGAYTSTMTMHRMDSYGDSGATLGERKSIRNVVFRTIDTGKVEVGYSEKDMQTTPNPLGSIDAKFAVNGGSMNELRLTVRSHGDEPLTLLALAYEGRAN